MSSFWSTERISDYLDDRLSVEERARVEEHLRENPADQEQLTEFIEMQQALRNAPRYELDSGFAGRVLNAIESSAPTDVGEVVTGDEVANQTSTEPSKSSATNWRYTASMVASLAAILLLSAFLLPNDFRTDEMAQLSADADARTVLEDEKSPISQAEKLAEPADFQEDRAVEGSVGAEMSETATPPSPMGGGGFAGDKSRLNLDVTLEKKAQDSGEQTLADSMPENTGAVPPAPKVGGMSRESQPVELVMVVSPEQNRKRIENLGRRWGADYAARPGSGLQDPANSNFENAESEATEDEADEDSDRSGLPSGEEETQLALEAATPSQEGSSETQLAFIVEATEDQLQTVLDSINATRVQTRDEFLGRSDNVKRDEAVRSQGMGAAEATNQAENQILSGEVLEGLTIRRVDAERAFSKSTMDEFEPSAMNQPPVLGEGTGFGAESDSSRRSRNMGRQAQQRGRSTEIRRQYLLVIQIVPNNAKPATPPPTDSANLPSPDKSSTDQDPKK